MIEKLISVMPPGDSGAAQSRLRAAFASYVRQEYAEACLLCEAALKLDPDLADASYLLGLIACRGGDADSGARALEHALSLDPPNRLYLAALADARLLQQREVDAFALYSRTFPELAAEIEQFSDAALPWTRAHPDWIRRLRHVTLPALKVNASQFGTSRPGGVEDNLPGHLLNWALLLVMRRRVSAAIHLLEVAVRADASLGYGQAALALLLTLNQDWERAGAAARAARNRGAEAFAGANDLCLLASQFGLDIGMEELDPLFDWSAFTGSTEVRTKHLAGLPPVEGLPFPRFSDDRIVYFLCCDMQYFFEHGIALAYSIRASCQSGAVHFHIFGPGPETWAAIQGLRKALAPLPLSVTWESVDFERHGGKRLYCACVRFCRLYQLLLNTPNRVVMLDVDSLVRAELADALSGCRDIGLAYVHTEPMWHRYLGGFTTFRGSPAAQRFLEELGAFLAANLLGGRARMYIDQIALYVCAQRCGGEFGAAIDHLPIERFCDTLFSDTSLVWSVTQDKARDSPYSQLKRSILKQFE